MSAIHIAEGPDDELPGIPYHHACLADILATRCRGQNQAKKVKILEDAAAKGKTYFDDVLKALQRYATLVPSCEARIKEINSIETRIKESKMTIGFRGGSGTGKSTLINQLLQMKLLPHSEEQASTAVAVEISYNNVDDPEKLYRAEIYGISQEEFQKELEDLWHDKDVLESGEHRHGDEEDLEIMQRINEVLTKIKCLFPEITSLEELDKTSPSDLLGRSQCALLDQTVELFSADLLQFARKIKGYIDTSKTMDGISIGFCQWPIVKVVKLYCKATILTNSITFVDLPGGQDTSAARVKVAEDYQKNLNITCVVSPAVRAGSDKEAQNLMTSNDRQTLQLDGLYNSASLFFIITKIDDLMDVNSYISDHPDLQAALQEDLLALEQNRQEIASASTQTAEVEKKRKRNEALTKRMKAGIRKLDRDFQKGLSPPAHKRSFDEMTESDFQCATDAQKAEIAGIQHAKFTLRQHEADVAQDGNKLYELSSKKQHLEKYRRDIMCRLRKACINNRNELQIRLANAEYQNGRREMGEKSSMKPLQVHCVSASSFYLLNSGDEENYMTAKSKGFISKQDTGIPTLRDALISTTWGVRERNALSFIEDVESSLTRLKQWSSDTTSDYRMKYDDRALLESSIEEHFRSLDKRFLDIHCAASSTIDDLIKNEVLANLPKAAHTAANSAINQVHDWCLKPVGWSTHKAINRRRGAYKSSLPLPPFDWNRDLANLYIKGIFKDWIQTFTHRLDDALRVYEGDVETAILEFTTSILDAGKSVNPAIHEALELLKENILRTRGSLKTQGSEIVSNIKHESKDAWRLVKPLVKKTWQGVYDECGVEKGKGLYDRNRERHNKFVKGRGGSAMYRAISKAIESALRKPCNGVEGELVAGYQKAIGQIKKDIAQTVEKHSTDGSRTSGRRGTSRIKIQLFEALQSYFEELEKKWGIEPDLEPEPELQVDQDREPDVEIKDEPEDESGDDFDFDFKKFPVRA